MSKHPGARDREDPGDATESSEQPRDPLDVAYEQRTLQVHEARSALAEAVHTLRLELEDRHREAAALQQEVAALRQEAARLRQDNRLAHEKAETLHKESHALGAEVNWLREQRASITEEKHRLTAENQALIERSAELERQLGEAREQVATLQNMKVVRWTVWPRRMVYRLRERGR
jgi:chromosome segregation ATPase